MNIQEIDKKYRDNLIGVVEQLGTTFNQIKDSYAFDLKKNEITEAIILRLKAYYDSQSSIKDLLEKGYLAAASDFFVESVIFFLKLYLINNNIGIEAKSEKDIKLGKYKTDKGKIRTKVIRPDITIYKNDKPVAIIECKTQLGWNRNDWKKDFEKRTQLLNSKYPDAKAYLLVMTGSNWGGFINDVDFNSQYFCLLNDIWPNQYEKSKQILSRVEDLFKKIN
ncbi:MAG: hypothetical protein K8R58_07050 [Bacteroidales bacterium]|nr:hypothetical protein [Bacteroidales bacterium]